jgi:hypothetical protein
LLTAGRLRTQFATPAYSIQQLEQHTAVQQSHPQGIYIIDLTESGEINLIWYDHVGQKVHSLVDWSTCGNGEVVPNLFSLLSVISK